jgi:hypothetical protein
MLAVRRSGQSCVAARLQRVAGMSAAAPEEGSGHVDLAAVVEAFAGTRRAVGEQAVACGRSPASVRRAAMVGMWMVMNHDE